MFGPTLGVLAGAFVIDRFERRTTLALCGGAMALIGVGFAASASPAVLMATGVTFNLIGAIYVAALSVYAAELFPTALRASVSSAAWAVNRVASAIAPLVLLPLLKTSGALIMFTAIGMTLLTGAAAVLTLGPKGLAGRPVR
jgi:putative MFS transporter